MAESTTKIMPYIFYRDLPAALQFLARAFGFVETFRTGTERGGIHAEMELDGQKIMMGQGGEDWSIRASPEAGPPSQGVFVHLADVDAHFAHARGAGAEIEKPPEDLPYGRSYTARDLEGHPWYFTTPPAEG